MNRSLPVLLIIFLPFFKIGFAQDLTQSFGRETLKGIETISVSIAKINPEARTYFLNQDALKTAVELRLRKADIKVMESGPLDLETGDPYLHVDLQIKPIEKIDLYSLAINVELHQLVRLTRDRSNITIAPTWSRRGIGDVGKSRLEDVKSAVLNHVDEFINEFLSVNQN